MKPTIFLSIIFTLSVGLLPICSYGQDSTKSSDVSNENIEIILNKVHDGGKSGIQSRHIFILIEEKKFNLENVRKTFEKYRFIYSTPFILTITIYSDKEMLQRLINFEKQPMTIEFSQDEKGQEAARKFYEEYYPLPTGYFRAEYSRYGDYEYFNYSPGKDKAEMMRISLKDEIKKEK